MKKTPEQVLTEWTTQEFTLDLGHGTKTYPVTEFYRLVIALALDGHGDLENFLKHEFQSETMRRAYSTAWAHLVSIILRKLDDKQAIDLMRHIFDPYKIMWLSGIVGFEDYFEQIIFDEFGIRDGLRLDYPQPIPSARINKICLNMFMPKGESRLGKGFVHAPYIPKL